ncbi:MAG TPA: hypothetical protein VIG30_04630 [Ktedonobacterales bacterium]|jgi:hypothetical protein
MYDPFAPVQPSSDNPVAAAETSPAATGDPTTREWVCPGVRPGRRLLTGAGVVFAVAVFALVAIWQGATGWVSTLIGIIFIGGFVGYLWIMAPTPFILRLNASGIMRTERGGEPNVIPWDRVAKIKEERFKSGRSVSVAVFKRVGERGLHRAYVVYGDDISDYDGFRAALRAGVPEDRPWLVETVHE